ncbi:MAG: SusC/RagA family TonB-linked outer membrane protein [Bacteroidota bacterium]|nr:SusC/RagA family TonB-linked outer membrane protein [Bacteroidota bacterium]
MNKKTACLRFVVGLVVTLLSLPILAQTKKISGKVLAEDNSTPLAGVSVLVKGKTAATQTLPDGTFTISVSETDLLVFSYTGYLTQEIPVKGHEFVSLSLKPDVQKLNEVVVVGYGTQSRRTLTGAVSSIDGNVLKSSPSSNLGTALQGTVSGLRVQQSTGQPGSTPNITFRGGTTFDGSNSSPLIILDGAVVPSIYGINMDDVESIDLMKDAGSLAIYGARAANGVLFITTKKGKKGRTQVNYSYRNTTNFIRYNSLQYLTAAQYIHWNRSGIESRWEADMADGNTNAANTDRGQNAGSWGWAVNSGWTSPIGLYSTQLLSNNNRKYVGQPGWGVLVDPNPFVSGQMDSILYHESDVRDRENMILQQNITQEHYLNFSGANDQGAFSLGLGMINDNGIVIGSQLKRLSVNFNGGLNVNKNLKVNLSLNGYTVNQLLPYTDPAGGGAGGLMQRFVGVAPTVRYYNDTSGAILPGPNDVTLGNPLYWNQVYVNNTNQQQFTGSLNVEYKILPHLKFIATGSGYMVYNNSNYFTKSYQQGNGGSINNTRPASFSNYRDISYTYNGFLQYDKSFGRHNVTLMAGGEFYDYKRYTFYGSAQGAPTDLFPWLSASVNPSIINGSTILYPQSASSSFSAWDRLASAIGRVNYSFANKYFVAANFRYDGTSRLLNNRYGFFPGISTGWNMQNENFFKNSRISKYINVLKPRISWGQTGALSTLGTYAADQVFPSTSVYNGLGGTWYPNIINSNLQWETSSTLNIGADITVLNNRITVIADYFIRDVYNKIAGLPIDPTTGFTSIQYNNGQLRNKGFELELKAKVLRPVKPGGLSIDFNTNLYTVRNFVVKLPYNGLPNNRQGALQVWDPNHPGQVMYVGGLQEGQRIGTEQVWAPRYDGIYNSSAALSADASVYNAFLPYTHKTLKLMGDARWHQVNQNDTIDSRQFVYVGRTVPSLMGGFSTVINYKGFSLYAQFDYALNFVILNNEKLRGLSQVQGSQNSTTEVLNTWSPSNPNGTLPRFYWANQGRNYATDPSGNNPAANFWERGDYLMVRELTLSYDFTQDALRGMLNNKIRSARFFVTGNNLAYFTKYSGNFPEIGGVDNGKFPLPRRLTLGVNLGL